MREKQNFLWAGGIENTFINHPHPVTGKRLDEYELTNHYDNWKSDVEMVASIPINSLRWGIPWYKANPKPGVFDLDWSKRVVDALLEKNIEPIIDLVHYGTPDWLDNSFLHPDYPDRVTEFTEAVLSSIGDRVTYFTPNNEPYTACEFCGLRGEWPPYGTSDEIFLSIMKQIGKGVTKTSHLLRDYHKVSVHVEVASDGWTDEPDLQAETAHFSTKQRIYWDMITGKITSQHRLYSWLLDKGWDVMDMQYFSDNPVEIDIMGLNFYPQWSISEFVKAQPDSNNSEWTRKPTPSGKEALKQLIEKYWDIYRVPIMITETSVYGESSLKTDWLSTSVAALGELREKGVEIVGYTWFPLLDMIDWNYRIEAGPSENFLINLGLWDSERKAYSAVKTYKEVIETSGL
ncbi:MAG: family 1 glycosylhydrolase [Bacteroidetes bacterium]|nr:family 1 glycosylhydrolase [Bacteroidota bacterium]